MRELARVHRQYPKGPIGGRVPAGGLSPISRRLIYPLLLYAPPRDRTDRITRRTRTGKTKGFEALSPILSAVRRLLGGGRVEWLNTTIGSKTSAPHYPSASQGPMVPFAPKQRESGWGQPQRLGCFGSVDRRAV